jgi:hypothetical protein
MHEWEKKKKKYLEACLLEQCQHFTPFVVSTKWPSWKRSQNPAEEAFGPAYQEVGKVMFGSMWICQCSMSIAIVQATHLCL